MAKTTKSEPSTVTISTTKSTKDTVGGTLEMSESVVATIANYVTKQIDGIHSVGKSGVLRDLVSGPRAGVEAEVGKSQAALDLNVVIEFGCNIQEVAAELREKIADAVEQMAGRKVVEVNVHVVDIKMPEEIEEEAPPRVI